LSEPVGLLVLVYATVFAMVILINTFDLNIGFSNLYLIFCP
jgi:hypothetical protein